MYAESRGRDSANFTIRKEGLILEIIFFLVCFGASTIGAICGIGGGVIIKPLLDAFGVMSVAAISFLSGCTVLSMTTYSVVRSKTGGSTAVEKKTMLPLALGAAVGGLLGKELFSQITALFADKNRVGAVQAACLLVITAGTLLYTFNKEKIRTHHVKRGGACLTIGTILGLMSSFLGIGGGPINLTVLFFFFSMQTKAAAECSLYIIFFSQLTNLLYTIFMRRVPEISVFLMILMVIGGLLGGICGRFMNKKLNNQTVDKLFDGMMIVIIVINIYNIYKYLG